MSIDTLLINIEFVSSHDTIPVTDKKISPTFLDAVAMFHHTADPYILGVTTTNPSSFAISLINTVYQSIVHLTLLPSLASDHS